VGGNEDSKERLARLVIERVRAEGGTEPRLDTEAFAVRYDGNSILHLDALFQDTFADEASGTSELAREAHVAHFVSTTMSSMDWPVDWNHALPRLRPVLKPSTYTLGSPSALLLSRRVFPLIDELVVVDMPAHRTVVSLATTEKWGIDPATVFAAARSNLAALTQHADPTKGRAVQRLVDDRPHDTRYFTSWLLDPGWLASPRGRFGCPPVAFAPDVDTIVVVPSDDPALLGEHFRRAEERYVHTSRALSPQAYTVDENDTVVTFDQIHPEDVGGARARCIHITGEYAAQGSWLTRQYELDGIRSEVGKVTVKATPFGPRTVTIWADNTDATMPLTDLVAFCQEGAHPFFVQFADVEALTGLTPVGDLDPARFRVRAWPPSTVMDQLRARAVPVE